MSRINLSTYLSSFCWLFILYFIYYVILVLNTFSTLINYIKLSQHKFLISTFSFLKVAVLMFLFSFLFVIEVGILALLLFIMFKAYSFSQKTFKALERFTIKKSPDWYQSDLVYASFYDRGLTVNELNFIKLFFETVAPKNSFKIKIWILSENGSMQYDIFSGFKMDNNFEESINSKINKILNAYSDVHAINPITNKVYISLIWVLDENKNWKTYKNQLEKTILTKKMSLNQELKILVKSIKISHQSIFKTDKRFYSSSTKDKFFRKIIKKNIPTMHDTIIDLHLNPKSERHEVDNGVTQYYTDFLTSLRMPIENECSEIMSENQRNDFNNHIARFIFKYVIITKQEGCGYISLSQITHFVHDYLNKIGIREGDLNNNTTKIINSIVKNTKKISIKKIEIGSKNLNGKFTGKGKETWVIYLLDYDKLSYIKDQFSSDLKSYLMNHPMDWIYENQNAFGGFSNEYNSIFIKLVDISLSNKILFKEIGDESLIKKINELQKIGCKYDLDTFLTIFKNYSIENFRTLIYKDREQFYDVVEKIMPNRGAAIKRKKTNESYGLEPQQLHKFFLTLVFLNKALFLSKETFFYSNIRLDHRLRYYYMGFYNHMNSKILRYLTQLKPLSKPSNKVDDSIKFYMSWQISKSKNIIEGIKKYEQFESTKIYDKKILDFRSPYVWLTTKIALKNERPFTISLDACASFQQIVGILIKDNNLLNYTNVTNISDNILDPYNHVIAMIAKNLPSDFIDYKDLLLSRKIVKQCIMTHTYGSNPWSIIGNLQESGSLELFRQDKKTVKVFKHIIDTFNEEFPNVKKLRQIIRIVGNYLVEHNTPVHFKYKNLYTKFSTNHVNENNIKIEVNEKTNQIATITLKKRSNDIVDKRKTSQSLLPNLVHFLDSQILLETRLNLNNSGIETLGIHDCIIIDHKYYNECVTEYNKSLSQLLDINIFDILNVDVEDIKRSLVKSKKTKKNREFLENIKIFETKTISKDTIIKARFTLLPT